MRRFAGIVPLLCLHLASFGHAEEPGVSELDGVWVEVVNRPSREEHPGYSLPRDPMTLVIDGHLLVGKAGDRAFRQSLIKLVPGQAPKSADLMTVVGGEFWLTRAIYKVEGDTLTIKEGARDQPRPTDFAPWEFDGRNAETIALLHVYKRRAESP